MAVQRPAEQHCAVLVGRLDPHLVFSEATVIRNSANRVEQQRYLLNGYEERLLGSNRRRQRHTHLECVNGLSPRVIEG